jgi:hypothetical protein
MVTGAVGAEGFRRSPSSDRMDGSGELSLDAPRITVNF